MPPHPNAPVPGFVADEALVQQIVEERMRAALDGTKARKKRPNGSSSFPSRWQYVPLTDLFSQDNPPAQTRPDGTLATGHEPFHKSKSGACVTLWPETGRWYCTSCKRSGDAATWVQQMLGCSYSEAARWLTERYGPPPGGPR